METMENKEADGEGKEERCKGKEEGHANAGSSEQLAAASESLSGELRATKYGTEGSEAYCARGRMFVSQRAPPRAPALATHGLNVCCKKTNRAPQRTYLLASVTL